MTALSETEMSIANGTRLAGLVDRTPVWVSAVVVFLALGALYATTAEWDDESVNVDAVAAALPAWSLVERGTIDLSDVPVPNPWISSDERGTFSNRPTGISLVAVPAYLLLGGPEFSNAPATLTAVLVAAGAITVLFMTLTRIMPPTSALIAAIAMAIGTATWPISSRQLWPHALGQLTAASALLGLARQRSALTGSAFAFGILIRPPTAIFPAVIGVAEILKKPRRWRSFLTVGFLSSVGLTAILLYNQAVFGGLGLSGGYSNDFSDRVTSLGIGDYLNNLADMFLLPPNGLVLWTPIVLVATIAAITDPPPLPRWAFAAAVAGLVYLVIHARANRASGGLPFNYRYPLEPLVMATPLLAASARAWLKHGGWRSRLILGSTLFGVIVQALYLFLLRCEPLTASEVLCSIRLGS